MSSKQPNERRTFAAVPGSTREARQFATALLAQLGAPHHVARDFTLVVSELITNFIEHSDGTSVDVVFDSTDPRWWELEVIGGAGAAPKRVPSPDTWTLAAEEQISGRGLGIVRQLMDEVSVEVGPDRVSVRCRRRRSLG